MMDIRMEAMAHFVLAMEGSVAAALAEGVTVAAVLHGTNSGDNLLVVLNYCNLWLYYYYIKCKKNKAR